MSDLFDAFDNALRDFAEQSYADFAHGDEPERWCKTLGYAAIVAANGIDAAIGIDAADSAEREEAHNLLVEQVERILRDYCETVRQSRHIKRIAAAMEGVDADALVERIQSIHQAIVERFPHCEVLPLDFDDAGTGRRDTSINLWPDSDEAGGIVHVYYGEAEAEVYSDGTIGTVRYTVPRFFNLLFSMMLATDPGQPTAVRAADIAKIAAAMGGDDE